jgi:alpha-L-arabinofuranosidase
MKKFPIFFTFIFIILFSTNSNAQTPDECNIVIDTRNELASISSNMYGIFFEDINFGADGGLYAEMIKNRSFEFTYPLMGWTPSGQVSVQTADPCFSRNPRYVQLRLDKNTFTGTALDNEGFRGMGFKENEQYRISVFARTAEPQAVLLIELIDSALKTRDTVSITVMDDCWKKYTATVVSSFTDEHGRLRVRLVTQGSVSLDHISLFPVNTWKNRENGMRRDIAQALNDLNPGVFRFPGGCIVEGTTLETRYQWKNTAGAVEDRPLNINRWFYTFFDRLFPDYFQSYGLGFYEYFQLCEDFGADALPVLNCGMACQFQDGPCVPLDQLHSYIEDALDLIEFANGPSDSRWGKLRAQMGHPEPFGLKMLAIGNEQWGPEYPARLMPFVKAVREKYPEILIIGSAGPYAGGELFEEMWPEMRRIGVDLVDEHYYMTPEWFLANAGRYDSYDRQGPKVFAGEFAAHDRKQGNANTFLSALAEAAFMTGLERNADVVRLATYAPLLAHKEAWQWNPDLIWFDNLSVVKTPNYYVQQLYAQYKGTNALQTSCNISDLRGSNGLYATSAIDKEKGRIIVKIVNSLPGSKEVTVDLTNTQYTLSSRAEVITLQSDDLTAVNTFEAPETIMPKKGAAALNGNRLRITLRGQSFSVIVLSI